MTQIIQQRKLWLAVMVASLGYFVDVYDIILFAVIRIPSLKALGLADEQVTTIGLQLMNIQLLGMLIGGVIWGALGDKRGRLSILFGSIILYSSANLANAFVTSVEQYAILRFLAGLGLAGELGAGITLVAELMAKKKRGIGTTIITTSGVFGGICGGLVGNLLTWQTAYILGGLAGFLLLIMRFSLVESGIYLSAKSQASIQKGSLWTFLKSPTQLKKYLSCLLVGIPFWIFVGLFMALAPEVAKELNVQGAITTGWAILFFNVGLGVGDMSSGLYSQWLGSRKKAVFIYLLLTLVFTMIFLSLRDISPNVFYFFCSAIGFSVGYWAVFLVMAAEQFGTNIRATVTVSMPNMIRGMGVPLTIILSYLRPEFGILWGLGLIAVVGILMAMIGLFTLKETFATSLDFVES